MEGGMEGKFTPRDWNDDDRMNFLFSAFPKDRNVNPRHWDSKMNYWVEEVKRCCLFYRDICVSCELIRERFTRNDRVPQGLSTVLDHMEKQGLLVSQESLLKNLGSGWINWTYSLVKTSTSWIWSNIWRGNTTAQQKEYVLHQSLEVLGLEILNRHYEVAKFEKTDHIVPWKVVKTLYVKSKSDINDEELLLVLAHLKSKKMVELVTNPQGEKVIKFAKNIDTHATAIDENDWHILRLRKAIAKLNLQIADDKKEILSAQKNAVVSLKQKDQTQAKRLMFQKKRFEKSMNLKQDTLLTLTDQLMKIRNADSTKMILDAISSSSALLNASLREDNISPEKIDDVFEQTIEAAEYAKEIDDSISQGLRHMEDESLQELEDELSELLLDKETTSEPTTEGAFELPNVPSVSPVKSPNRNRDKNKVRALAS